MHSFSLQVNLFSASTFAILVKLSTDMRLTITLAPECLLIALLFILFCLKKFHSNSPIFIQSLDAIGAGSVYGGGYGSGPVGGGRNGGGGGRSYGRARGRMGGRGRGGN